MSTDTGRLRRALSEVDFPAEKEELVRCAYRAGADDATLSSLDAMPPVSYGSLDEVFRSARQEPERNSADRAAQRRRHTRPGLAEHEKDVPAHPITDELGENRGS